MEKTVGELTLNEALKVCHHYSLTNKCESCPIACNIGYSSIINPALRMVNFNLTATVDMNILKYPVKIAELVDSKFCEFQCCENCPIIIDGTVMGIHIKSCAVKLSEALPPGYREQFRQLTIDVKLDTMRKMGWTSSKIESRIQFGIDSF